MKTEISGDGMDISHHIDVGPDHGLITGIGAIQEGDADPAICHWTFIRWRTDEAAIVDLIYDHPDVDIDLEARGSIPGCPEPIPTRWDQ